MAQSFQTKNKIAIIGAGPAGIYCAINILNEFKKNNFNDFFLDIYDKSQVLRTILPTGNGRCNLTNAQSDIKDFVQNYPRGEKFLYSLFSRHSNFDSVDFFNSIGIETYTQDDMRIFPKSNSSKEVKDKLLNFLKKFKNHRLINKNIESVDDLNNYSKIIIAAGSKNTANLLSSTKQPFFDFKPSLTSLKIENHIYPIGTSVKTLEGDFIFTHQGISGPLIYKLSSINAKKNFPYKLKIHLFNYEDLIELANQNPKKSIGNLVARFVPKSFARAIIKDFDKNSCEISKKEIEKYSYIEFNVISYCKDGEIVNCGGVDLNFIDKNCKSKVKDNLWFCGEILNIDGFCGGFNLQNCWSSSHAVALDVVQSVLGNYKELKNV